MRKPLISHERAVMLIAYSPETGEFRWRLPRRFCSAGKKAGSTTRYGYIKISIEGRNYQAHRLAWFLVHGTWPVREIDHINGVRNDNRLCNLREATPSQNQANKAMRKDNTSGVKGVFWDRNKWKASTSVSGRSMVIGRFDRIEDAEAAYQRAVFELFGEFARPERKAS